MTDDQTVEYSRTSLSISSLAKYTVKAWFMSLRSDAPVSVSFLTSSGGRIDFAQFLKGRKLP